MKYFDQHVHTLFSADSKEDPAVYAETAANAGLERFVSTEHLEFDWNNEKRDWIPDFAAQKKLYADLSQRYGISMEQGVELGYKSDKISDFNAIIADNALTHVNLSVHDYRGYDLYYAHNDMFSPEEVIEGNLIRIEEAVDSAIDFDILSHVDYAFKTMYAEDQSLCIEKWEKRLESIFRTLASRQKALEINLKVQSVIKSRKHLTYLLGLFRSCGGRFIALSSDAHRAEKYLSDLPFYAAVIAECGFESLCFFVDRKPCLEKISALFPFGK